MAVSSEEVRSIATTVETYIPDKYRGPWKDLLRTFCRLLTQQRFYPALVYMMELIGELTSDWSKLEQETAQAGLKAFFRARMEEAVAGFADLPADSPARTLFRFEVPDDMAWAFFDEISPLQTGGTYRSNERLILMDVMAGFVAQEFGETDFDELLNSPKSFSSR